MRFTAQDRRGFAPECRFRSAFTLIELLVATAVLGLILALLLQVCGGALSTTRASNQKMEAEAEARAALDALNGDMMNLISRQSVPVFVKADAGNSEIAFLTQSRGAQAGTRFLGVNYHLDTDGLRRTYQSVAWDDAPVGLLASAIPSGSPSNVLAKGILRFEAVAILEDGSIVPLAANSGWNDTKIDGESVSNGFLGLNVWDASTGRKRVRSLVVGVVTLDERNRGLLDKMGKLDQVKQAFPSPSAGETPMQVWEGVLSDGSLAGVSPSVTASLKVVQHTYSLK